MGLLTCLLCAACTNRAEPLYVSPDGSSDSELDSSIESKTHQIAYKAIINDVAEPKEIPSELWINGNNYPDKYVEGEVIQLDDLLNEYQSKTLRLVFLGWFTDVECQNAFTGILTEHTKDVTIYAKIKRERYTVPA